ncbi:hypothetical protein GOV12_05155 [Candidatus Pacearchaeota archaeon]|nr:hypothetical protein [Candidatus Pacearchaeota archaeon]
MVNKNKLLLIANNAAIDATIYTKGDAIVNYSQVNQVPLEQIAGIGDEIIDISFLTTQGLALAGAPANAQQQVLETIKQLPNGWISKKESLDGFLEFYDLARKKGITHVVTDRDGVVYCKGDYSRGREFQVLLENMGIDNNPHIAVLTGSGYVQNQRFMIEYGMTQKLSDINSVKRDPYLLLAENGLIQINVLTGETRNLCGILNQDLLKRLKKEFEPKVIKEMQKSQGILEELGLSWSNDYEDQKAKVFIPPKQAMTTFNVPREYANGKPDYRKSPEADHFRKQVIKVMEKTAKRLNIPYQVI